MALVLRAQPHQQQHGEEQIHLHVLRVRPADAHRQRQQRPQQQRQPGHLPLDQQRAEGKVEQRSGGGMQAEIQPEQGARRPRQEGADHRLQKKAGDTVLVSRSEYPANRREVVRVPVGDRRLAEQHRGSQTQRTNQRGIASAAGARTAAPATAQRGRAARSHHRVPAPRRTPRRPHGRRQSRAREPRTGRGGRPARVRRGYAMPRSTAHRRPACSSQH